MPSRRRQQRRWSELDPPDGPAGPRPSGLAEAGVHAVLPRRRGSTSEARNGRPGSSAVPMDRDLWIAGSYLPRQTACGERRRTGSRRSRSVPRDEHRGSGPAGLWRGATRCQQHPRWDKDRAPLGSRRPGHRRPTGPRPARCRARPAPRRREGHVVRPGGFGLPGAGCRAGPTSNATIVGALDGFEAPCAPPSATTSAPTRRRPPSSFAPSGVCAELATTREGAPRWSWTD